MLFAEKADYAGHYDSSGVPQLDYHGHIGLQYNPIAIAQYGLGNYNLWCRASDASRKKKFFLIADWLAWHLEPNLNGICVWNHHFNWEYRDTLKAPWYSALAQGQGISVLVRAHKESGDARYLDAARAAFVTFQRPIEEGGVAFTDESGDLCLRSTSSPRPRTFSMDSSGRSGESTTTRSRPKKVQRRNYSRAESEPCCTISTATISDSGRSTSNPARVYRWSPARFTIACTLCSCVSCTAWREKNCSSASQIAGKITLAAASIGHAHLVIRVHSNSAITRHH
jgi:hypothetical protein